MVKGVLVKVISGGTVQEKISRADYTRIRVTEKTPL
jgi:hypothetical protein